MKFSDKFRVIYSVRFPRGFSRAFVSAMICADIPFGDVEFDDGECVFTARRRDVSRIRETAERLGVEARFELCGFPRVIYKYRRRAGLLVGAVAAAAIMFISSRFVWDIEIPDGEKVSAEQIGQALEDNGFFLGAYLPTLDISSVCKKAAAQNGDLSWLSINMRGTVARVEFRETSDAETEAVSPPSNLVAAQSGQIVRIESVGGKNVVRVGQVVKAGDILVSGVIDSEALGYRLVRSRGEVYAAVTKTFSATVPLTLTEKTPTGRTKTEKNVIFFSKKAKKDKNIDTTFEKYDTIEKTERLSAFGIRLPVFVVTTTLVEYEDARITLSQDEAKARAAEAAFSELYKVCGKSEVLSVFENAVCDGEGVTVEITVEYIANIAAEQIIMTEQK